jgi:hypothetical protein
VEQIRSYADKRQISFCVYCGGPPETRDHVPSRILLDQPYPDNLTVVPACRRCNEGVSKDEEYLACLLECVTSAATTQSELKDRKVARILATRPAIRARLEAARYERDGAQAFHVEVDRVTKVMQKLAQGHAAFELNEPQLGDHPTTVFRPFAEMREREIDQFETPPATSIWPEVGSRAVLQILSNERGPSARWITVQPGRYRYLACTLRDGVLVRFVLRGYLACEVCWS